MKYKWILIACLPFTASAQEKDANDMYGIKLYNTTTPNTQFRNITTSPATFAFAETQYLKPSLAVYKKTRNNNLHELELAGLSINKVSDKVYTPFAPGPDITTSGREQTITNIALRYEYIIPLIKKGNPHVVPSIGMAAMPYYTRYRLTPFVASYYPSKATYAGVQLAAVPRLNIYTNKRIFFDLNVPVTFANAYYERTVVNNPSLSNNEKDKSVLQAEFGQWQYSIRLGAGIRI